MGRGLLEDLRYLKIVIPSIHWIHWMHPRVLPQVCTCTRRCERWRTRRCVRGCGCGCVLWCARTVEIVFNLFSFNFFKTSLIEKFVVNIEKSQFFSKQELRIVHKIHRH